MSARHAANTMITLAGRWARPHSDRMTVDDSRLRYISTTTVGVAKSRNIAACESRAARGHDLSLHQPSLLTNRSMSPRLTSWLFLFALAVLLIAIVGIVLFTRLHAVL